MSEDVPPVPQSQSSSPKTNEEPEPPQNFFDVPKTEVSARLSLGAPSNSIRVSSPKKEISMNPDDPLPTNENPVTVSEQSNISAKSPSISNKSAKSFKSMSSPIIEKTDVPTVERVSATLEKAMTSKMSSSKPANSPLIDNKIPSPRKSSIVTIEKTKTAIADQKASRSASKAETDNLNSSQNVVTSLEPLDQTVSDAVNELNDSVQQIAQSVKHPIKLAGVSNLNKIANMSKILTDEANALRASIRSLSKDIARTKQDLGMTPESGQDDETIDFPHHLFLLELIVNKIKMKCECFDTDSNNLVITASFLGKNPLVIYDSNGADGDIENLEKLNVGKSILFAITYDRICSIKEFNILLELSKQPPCSHCVTKVAETRMDFTKEFVKLRNELCMKWKEEQPTDNISCTTLTPFSKDKYYLTCGQGENTETIGVAQVSVRMSFLGKEVTTVFPKPRDTSMILKQNNGVTMYSCQKVEMDDAGKILLDEDVLREDEEYKWRRSVSPDSRDSKAIVPTGPRKRRNGPPYSSNNDEMARYDEIFTRMNLNELKIRVPKSTRVDRNPKYERISELCTCESNSYNTGDQIQFELPKDVVYPDRANNTYSSNLKYTHKLSNVTSESKDKKVINVTPTNCPIPVDMEKKLHPRKDVFVLKIGKKLETKDKKTELEIELVTPKAPSENIIPINEVAQQCNDDKATSSKKKKKKKSKSKTSLKKKKSKGKLKGSRSKARMKKK